MDEIGEGIRRAIILESQGADLDRRQPEADEEARLRRVHELRAHARLLCHNTEALRRDARRMFEDADCKDLDAELLRRDAGRMVLAKEGSKGREIFEAAKLKESEAERMRLEAGVMIREAKRRDKRVEVLRREEEEVILTLPQQYVEALRARKLKKKKKREQRKEKKNRMLEKAAAEDEIPWRDYCTEAVKSMIEYETRNEKEWWAPEYDTD